MFLGVVPDGCISQIIETVDFGQWPDIYVACSGTFRFERAIAEVHPQARLVSNDVSVFSVPLGRYALGEETPLTFQGKLAFVEELLAGRPYIDRLAAMLVASDYAKHKAGKPNRFKEAHARHYEASFRDLILATSRKLEGTLAKVKIAGFYAGDWLKHIDAAIERRAGVIAFSPFFKNGYEKMFQFLSENIAWDAPKYEIWDPKNLQGVVDRIAASGVPYCILSDQVLERHERVLEYHDGSHLPHYCYASTDHHSFRAKRKSGTAFSYRPLDPAKLTADTKVVVVESDADKMNFLKDTYLAKAIQHSTGVANYFVYLDGMLAGGVIYALSKYGAHDTLYLLSDFSTTQRGRVSKLIAKIAMSRDLIGPLEKRYLWRFRKVFTTAFTHKPVSMKYRGVMEVVSRKKHEDPRLGNMINYEGPVSEMTVKDTYAWWWAANAKKG